jgi:hypothetical protein
MKSILLSVLLSLNLLGTNECGTISNELKENEAYLYYMNSNEQGYFFLEPTHDENIVFISYNDYDEFQIDISILIQGKKFIGTFDDKYKWELLKIKEVQ